MRRSNRWLGLAFLLPFFPLVLAVSGCPMPDRGLAPSASPDGYLYCFWNVENLFDDQLDHRPSEVDRPYDEWFAEDRQARELKYRHLSQALLKMNAGKGPDILAIVEVESQRAAELLRNEINNGLADEALHYGEPIWEEVNGGRHIAPAILLRKDFRASRTHLLEKKHRILETHITANGHELILITSHWTSRVSDKEGIGRDKYAKAIYGRYRAIHHENAKADILIAGDFNDPPDADSVVRFLHATADRDAVLRGGGEPELFNLMAGKSALEFGTQHHKQMAIFDQIVVSPGLLDQEGWTCDPDSINTLKDLTADQHGYPKAYGNRKHGERGYSDHFPVTVRLRVADR
ncbi:MAG: endonuclease/exonuclease/phosphatase family protein [Gemmataceae bacterium]